MSNAINMIGYGVAVALGACVTAGAAAAFGAKNRLEKEYKKDGIPVPTAIFDDVNDIFRAKQKLSELQEKMKASAEYAAEQAAAQAKTAADATKESNDNAAAAAAAGAAA